jgi:hypothetical protein
MEMVAEKRSREITGDFQENGEAMALRRKTQLHSPLGMQNRRN